MHECYTDAEDDLLDADSPEVEMATAPGGRDEIVAHPAQSATGMVRRENAAGMTSGLHSPRHSFEG